jgi:hypothetical protein
MLLLKIRLLKIILKLKPFKKKIVYKIINHHSNKIKLLFNLIIQMNKVVSIRQVRKINL